MDILVADYDNTLFVNEEQIEITKKRIKELQEQGLLFMISTGRSLNSIQEQLFKYNIPFDYLSCADGSIIYDNNYHLIKQFVLDKDVVKVLNSFKRNIIFDKIQYSYPEGYSQEFSSIEQLNSINFVISNNNINEKVLDKFKNLRVKYPNYNYLIYYHEPIYYLCIKPYNISKASSIYYLIDSLKLNNIYVIGDSSNDYEMIRDFNGVCVKSATDDIKKISSHIYDDIDEYIDEIKKKQN